MPSPRVEMRTVHDSLKANNRDGSQDRSETALVGIRARQDRQRLYGICETGDRFVDWLDGLTSSFEMLRARSETEDSVEGTMGSVEMSHTRPVARDSFADPVALGAYDGLSWAIRGR